MFDMLILSKPLFIISLFVLSVLSLWAIIQTEKSKIFGLFFIPFILFVSLSTYVSVRSFEGYPIEAELVGKNFTLLAFEIHEPELIYLWLMEEGINIPRSYQIPYRKGTHKNLEALRKQLAQGGKKIQGFLDPSKLKKEGVAKSTPDNNSRDQRSWQKDPYTWGNVSPSQQAPKDRVKKVESEWSKARTF